MATNDILTLLVVLVLYVFICGAPLFTIMLAGTALGTVFSTRGFEINFDGAINKMFRISSRDEIEVLSTIPLFISAGYILAEARTADRLVRFANAMMGWMPGGLAIVTIGTCALFTVFTGASGVTIIALGGVLMPALVRNGYPEKFSMGLIAGTGSVGLLFPPALPLFIYGTVYGLTGLDKETWATERFLFAGVVPGLVLIGMLSAVAIVVAIRKKLPRQKFAFRELAISFLIALPELFIPFGVILGLATGFALPDIAALTVVYVLVLELGIFRLLAWLLERFRRTAAAAQFRTIKFGQLGGISVEAIAMIGAIFAIIFASTAFTDFMVNAEVPRKLVIFTQEHVSSKIVFLLAINVILLIVGTVMDIFSAIVVVLPLIAPISRAYGIDPYHLGVIFLLNLEVGYLHPPVGLNLFLTSVKFQRPITEVMWATIPFLITMIVALLVITYVPALTWVPPPERVAPVNNLVEIVDNGVEESKVSISEVVLVDAAGTPLVKDAKKQLDEVEQKLTDPKVADRDKPALKTKQAELKRVVRKLVDCRQKPGAQPAAPAAGAEAKPESPEDRDRKIQNCQKLFFDVTKCRPDPKNSPPDALACANKAIATWTVERLNEDDPVKAIIVVDKVALVDDANAPLTLEEEVLGPDGLPQKDKEDNTITKTVAIVGPDGKSPVTRTLAWCDELEFSADRETCRKLFVAASNCKINFELPEASCVEAKCPANPTKPVESRSAGSGAATPAAANDQVVCKQAAIAECTKQPVEACILAAAKEWASDYHSVALRPKLKGSKTSATEADDESDLGLSLKGGLIGLAIVVATQFLMRRRRRDPIPPAKVA